jgi:excisionase family DNA binding protein
MLVPYKRTKGVNNMNEILTAKEVAAMLRISPRQVYELAKEVENPIPSIRIRTSVRFRRCDVDGWLAKLAHPKAA